MTEQEYQARLAEERERIDHIDSQLLPLFIERMGCVERVAKLKGQVGAPVRNVQREQEILERVRSQAGEFGGSAVAFFQSLMAISRAREHGLLEGGTALRELERTAQRTEPRPQRVVCQGVRGAYSHQAARKLFDGSVIEFVPEFSPVENSAAGSVTAVYDLMLRYRFYIVGAVDVRAQHCVAVADSNAPVTQVLSHPPSSFSVFRLYQHPWFEGSGVFQYSGGSGICGPEASGGNSGYLLGRGGPALWLGHFTAGDSRLIKLVFASLCLIARARCMGFCSDLPQVD